MKSNYHASGDCLIPPRQMATATVDAAAVARQLRRITNKQALVAASVNSRYGAVQKDNFILESEAQRQSRSVVSSRGPCAGSCPSVDALPPPPPIYYPNRSTALILTSATLGEYGYRLPFNATSSSMTGYYTSGAIPGFQRMG
jgi:hypothetical protein